MGRLCLIPGRTPLSGMTFNQFARKPITSLNGCQGRAALATPQFSFLDLGREGAGGRAFPHPEQGTYPLW